MSFLTAGSAISLPILAIENQNILLSNKDSRKMSEAFGMKSKMPYLNPNSTFSSSVDKNGNQAMGVIPQSAISQLSTNSNELVDNILRNVSDDGIVQASQTPLTQN